MLNNICVFCGSSPGTRPEYSQAAVQLGKGLVRRNLGLVYGGAGVGIMGTIARTVLEGNGQVIGVIPKGLVQKEVALSSLQDLRVVESMHERKAMMMELSDGFIAMPGGLGTLEEFIEVLTWAQLGIHAKPCGLLNTGGFYDKLIDFLDHVADQKFMDRMHRHLILIDDNADHLLEQFADYTPPVIDKIGWALKMNSS